MRRMLIVCGVFGLAIVVYILYLAATYIDETVKEGEAYGFAIGDSKIVTYNKAKIVFRDRDVFILHPIDENGFGPHIKISFSDDERKMILNRASWVFFFDEGFFDQIKLTFTEGNLSKIYRHRKKFELP